MNATATPQGAADPDVNPGEVVVAVNPRQEAIDAMSARADEARDKELSDAIAADPGLAAKQASIDAQIQASNDEARARGDLSPEVLDPDGAASRVAMHPAQAPSDSLPKSLADDPLSEYIVMDNGTPMFQAKVNGEIRLIPLDQARRQIQIGTAAEVRMQNAASVEAGLQERESNLATREQALAQRTTQQPVVPAQADLSDEDLLDEARDIFSTAFGGTEEDAAKKLARTLSKLRAPTAVAAPFVDENAIASRAAKAAVGAIQNVNRAKDVKSGYEQFKTDYPEIMEDGRLYKMADDMTDEIARDNPEWDISQVMQEAGTRTRAWVNQMKGIPVEPGQPVAIDTPVLPQHPTQTRQERKSELVRMPTPAAAAVHQEPVDVPEVEQTPQEALAELKQSRGQPT